MTRLPSLLIDAGGHLDLRALDVMQSPCWLFDPYGHRMLHGNPAALRMWGAATLQAFVARDISDASVALRIHTASAAAKVAAGAVLQEQITLYPQGRPVTVEALLSGVRMPDGSMAMLIEAREQTVRRDEVRALEALRHLPALVSLCAEDGTVLFRNPAATATYPRDGMGFGVLFAHAAVASAFQEQAWGGTPTVAEMLALTLAGPRWHRVEARRTADPATGHPCLLVNEQDVEAERAIRCELEHSATHDPLTGLANRTLFRRLLEGEAGLRGPFTLLLVDLHRFKAVNDTLGHEAGDSLLQAAAHRMRDMLRMPFTLARLGGDEFGVLLPGLGCRKRATDLAAALIAGVSREYGLMGQVASVDASIGIALHDGERRDAPEALADGMIRAADRALYSAKLAGRGTFRMAA